MRDWSHWKVFLIYKATTFPQCSFLVSSQGGTVQYLDKPLFDSISTALIQAPLCLNIQHNIFSPFCSLSTPLLVNRQIFRTLTVFTVYLKSLALLAISAVAQTLAPEPLLWHLTWKFSYKSQSPWFSVFLCYYIFFFIMHTTGAVSSTKNSSQ